VLNIQQRARPSTIPAWTPKPIIRRVQRVNRPPPADAGAYLDGLLVAPATRTRCPAWGPVAIAAGDGGAV
jgi:hypothetical protein